MYEAGLKRDFKAKHYLPNEEGVESEVHFHDYTIEVIMSGDKTDENGYLSNLNKIEEVLTEIIGEVENETLNHLPRFENINPSLENFSKIVWEIIDERMNPENASYLKIKIFESENEYASYEGKLKD